MSVDYEVAIVGAGVAGACAAALLARHAGIEPSRVALIDGELSPGRLTQLLQPPQLQAPPQVRVVALSRASERVLNAAGAWQCLPPVRLCAYERMRVWHASAAATGAAALCFDAADIGEPNLGHIVENSLLQRACLQSFRDAGGTLLGERIEAFTVEAREVRLRMSGERSHTARLLVGADGADSQVRAQLPIAVRRRAYRQQALVAVVHTARPHEHTAWQRFLPTGPLALLPLFDGSSALTWSLDEPRGEQLVECSARQFNEQLDEASAQVLGATTLSSERRCFPLSSLASEHYVAPRCALIGDAAHVIHPLAGQGANLALLDAAALCESVAAAIAQREDPGALRLLRRYEQQRRTHNVLMDAAMNAFQWGFAASSMPGAWLINQGLGVVNRSAILKALFARQALGSGGLLPKLARGAR